MSTGVEMYSVYVALSFVGYCYLAIRGRCITRHPQGRVGEDKDFSFAISFADHHEKKFYVGHEEVGPRHLGKGHLGTQWPGFPE
jgi:hypothetical protein